MTHSVPTRRSSDLDEGTLAPGGTKHLTGEHVQRLIPTLDQISQEYVLVQAWKKAASYIRYHNWFSDTLELDRAAADLPRFVSRLSARLRSGKYETDELKLVPADRKSTRLNSSH